MDSLSVVRSLVRRQDRRAAYVENADTYRFRLSPTCPPSTSIHFHGGLAWWPVYSLYPAGFFIPSYTVDLLDTTKTYGEFIFDNANWYVAALLGVDQDMWPPPEPPDTWPDTLPDNCLYIYSSDEFETAAEAEVGVRQLSGEVVSFWSVCMGGIVLRNNGNTIDYNQFMPIDPINRGRSYIFGNRKRYGWELT
jgi:hypothetical protein